MPHVIVKMYPGRTEAVKQALADRIAEDVAAIARCAEQSVSVAIEEVPESQWADKVYKTDIMTPGGILYKQPGYNPFDRS